MSIIIGRLGSLGIGLESSPGTYQAPSLFLPYTEIGLRSHHKPLADIASKAARVMDKSSVVGQKWGEGDIKMNLDMVVSGILWKMALGNELVTGGGNPYSHTFYPSVSGNTPKTATLVYTRGDNDIEQYTYASLDNLTLEVAEGLVSLHATFKTQFGALGSAQTPVTTSGTILSFKDMSVQFGTSISNALQAAATPVSKFSLEIMNHVTTIHRSGSATVSAIRTKGIKVQGKYTIFFENITDRDAYYNLLKRSMVVTFTGNVNESLVLHIPQFRLDEGEIHTGLEDFYVVNASFVAEDVTDTNGTRLFDAVLQNPQSATY